MRFEWDEAKNLANQRKHGVSFEEASEVFADDIDQLEIFDDVHSDTEDRLITLGPVRRGLVLVVWTKRADDVIRIISARWATPREAQRYRTFLEQQR